ncbi:MAG TPA: GNAT family N-acetyltransferase [Allosphingosinicella sp.]|nr:GNAT family N-acetyltransferase [Allosphingosinicella sp.]
MNAVALAAFAQYEGVYSDWETLVRGVGATAELAQSGELVVAEQEGGAIVGAVAYFGPFATPRADFFEPHWPIIRMLVVDPAARGRGLGRRLTEQCLARARRDGAAQIALHTSPAMADALALYLRMGFRLERRVPDRFGVRYGLYLKALPPPSEGLSTD